MYGMTYELIEITDSGLSHNVSVRYIIIGFGHVVQVFDKSDIQSVRNFHVELLEGTKRLQCDHLSHELT